MTEHFGLHIGTHVDHGPFLLDAIALAFVRSIAPKLRISTMGALRASPRLPRWYVGAALSLVMSSCILPGGGGSEQIVPEVIHVGQPATFQLVMSAVDVNWVRGRFRNLKLFYRLVSDSSYRQASPSRRFGVDQGREGYEFLVPPYPAGSRDTLEFYFTFRFDGHPNTARGYKRIPVE